MSALKIVDAAMGQVMEEMKASISQRSETNGRMRMSKAREIVEAAMELILEEMKVAIKVEDFVAMGGLISALGNTVANLRESGAKVEEHEEEEK